MPSPAPLTGPFRPDLPLRTERLLLRPIDPVGDVDAMHAYRSREDVCRYIPPEPRRTREEMAAFLAQPEVTRTVLEAEGQYIQFAVALRETGQLIGDVIFFWRSALHRNGEIGYVFNPDFHGHGYATEAAEALLELAFHSFGFRRVIARVDAENNASAAVLRRLGMRQEALLVEDEWFKGRWGSEIDFAMLDREWRARQAAAS
jgi:RimJ/RimL family protein N-acetyltransferase